MRSVPVQPGIPDNNWAGARPHRNAALRGGVSLSEEELAPAHRSYRHGLEILYPLWHLAPLFIVVLGSIRVPQILPPSAPGGEALAEEAAADTSGTRRPPMDDPT